LPWFKTWWRFHRCGSVAKAGRQRRSTRAATEPVAAGAAAGGAVDGDHRRKIHTDFLQKARLVSKPDARNRRRIEATEIRGGICLFLKCSLREALNFWLCPVFGPRA
jgi:hypothetical protein